MLTTLYIFRDNSSYFIQFITMNVRFFRHVIIIKENKNKHSKNKILTSFYYTLYKAD